MQFKPWGFTRYGRFKKDAEVKEPVTKSQEISTTVALILTLFVKTCLLWEVDSLWKSTNKLISKWVSVETLHLTHSSFFPSKVHEGSQLLLSACLSCDGCVSEEESLKISQQSLEEVDRVLALNKVQRTTKLPLRSWGSQGDVLCDTFEPYLTLSPLFLCPCQRCDVSKHRVLVASICPQSLPFFAVKFGVDITEAAHKLCGFLKSLGEQVGFVYHCLQRSCKIFAQY